MLKTKVSLRRHAVVFALVLIFLLSACSSFDGTQPGDTVMTYSDAKDQVFQIFPCGDSFAFILSDADHTYTAVAYGAPDSYEKIYTLPEGSSVASICASDDCIAFYEQADLGNAGIQYKLHVFSTSEKELNVAENTVFKPTSETMYPVHISAFGGDIYYILYNDNTFCTDIMAYDIADGSKRTLKSIPYCENKWTFNYSSLFCKAENGFLTVNRVENNKNFLDVYKIHGKALSDQYEFSIELPDEIKVIYDASYIPKKNAFASYFLNYNSKRNKLDAEYAAIIESDGSINVIQKLDQGMILRFETISFNDGYISYSLKRSVSYDKRDNVQSSVFKYGGNSRTIFKYGTSVAVKDGTVYNVCFGDSSDVTVLYRKTLSEINFG